MEDKILKMNKKNLILRICKTKWMARLRLEKFYKSGIKIFNILIYDNN